MNGLGEDPWGAADVLVVGSLNVDLVCRVLRRPAPGETVMGQRLDRHPGGKGANQASAAARAGVRTSLVGAVGDDHYGTDYLAALSERGVDTSGIRVLDDAGTGVAIIEVTPDGENSIVIFAGANEHVSAADLPEPTDIQRGSVVVCQLEVPVATVSAAAVLAERTGARFLLNPSPIQDLPGGLLERSDPLVVNTHEAHHLLSLVPTGAGVTDEAGAVELAARLVELGPQSVVLTLGPSGAVWLDSADGLALHEPAPTVSVVDTTGAGDAFTGTLAAALASGRPRRPALAAAVAAGSEASTWPGAQPWRFDRSPASPEENTLRDGTEAR